MYQKVHTKQYMQMYIKSQIKYTLWGIFSIARNDICFVI
jgi:hypothetical protein